MSNSITPLDPFHVDSALISRDTSLHIIGLTKDFLSRASATVDEAALHRSMGALQLGLAEVTMGSEDVRQAIAESPDTLAVCVAKSVVSGLYPGGPFPDVWLIPRKNGRRGDRMELNWQLAASAWRTIGERVGYRTMTSVVYSGDFFEESRGLRPDLIHRPVEPGFDMGDPEEVAKNIRAAYAVVIAPTYTDFEVLWRGDIERRRGVAQTKNVWDDWPAEKSRTAALGAAGRRGLIPVDPQTAAAMAMASAIAAAEAPRVALPVVVSPATVGALGSGAQTTIPAVNQEDQRLAQERRFAEAETLRQAEEDSAEMEPNEDG